MLTADLRKRGPGERQETRPLLNDESTGEDLEEERDRDFRLQL